MAQISTIKHALGTLTESNNEEVYDPGKIWWHLGDDKPRLHDYSILSNGWTTLISSRPGIKKLIEKKRFPLITITEGIRCEDLKWKGNLLFNFFGSSIASNY